MIKLFKDENRIEVIPKPMNITLTYTECIILDRLINNMPKITTFEELAKIIWDNEIDNNYLEAIRVHMARLRKKGLKIKTIAKRGYVLED